LDADPTHTEDRETEWGGLDDDSGSTTEEEEPTGPLLVHSISQSHWQMSNLVLINETGNGRTFTPQAKQAHTATASYASHWGK